MSEDRGQMKSKAKVLNLMADSGFISHVFPPFYNLHLFRNCFDTIYEAEHNKQVTDENIFDFLIKQYF